MVVSGDLSRPPDDDDLCLVFHPKTFPDSIYTLQYVSTPPLIGKRDSLPKIVKFLFQQH